MIFESLASKRPQEAALFLRPYLVSVLGLPVAKPHLWSSLVCKDYIIPHIVTLFLHTDSYIYIFPNRRLTGCIQFRLKIVSEVLVFKDDKIIVKIPFKNGVIKDNYFQWELR